MPKFECIARGAFHGGAELAIGDVVEAPVDEKGNPVPLQMPRSHFKLQGTDTPPPKGVSGEVRDVAPDAINRRLGSEQFVETRTKAEIKAGEASAKPSAAAAKK